VLWPVSVILKSSNAERERHQERAAKLKQSYARRACRSLPSESHIVPILVGDPVTCKDVTDALLSEHGIYVQPINYPPCARTERLRLTPSPLHTDEMMGELIGALLAVGSRFNIKRAA